MKMSIIKCLSLFVASGNGARCNQMRTVLRDTMMVKDLRTGLSKTHLHKHCKADPRYKEDHYRVGREIGRLVSTMLVGIDDSFYSPDENVPNTVAN